MAIKSEHTSQESVADAETGGEDRAAQSAEQLPLDQVFEILKNERRRTVLRFLVDQREEMKLGELAEEVAAVENDIEVAAVTSDQRKRVYVGLYQCHLPKMDEMGIVEFNKNRGRIAPGPNIDQLTEYLDIDADDDPDRWHEVYLGITAVGVALMGLSYVGVAWLTPGVALGALVVAIGCCSVLQAASS